MKFHWFHLMPYPDLPEDFRQKYRSVWVDVPAALYDPVRGHEIYHEYLDELEYADSVGFDGICVNEHHQNAYGLMPSPNLMAATLTRRTSRAKIVVMGDSVALYNPPVRVAEEFAMLDVMSGGRLVAGFPVGTPMDTTFCYGEPPATLRDKYREATLPPEQLAALLGLLQGLTSAGKFLWPIPDKGLRRRLHRVSAPTLVIWGAADRLISPAYADDWVGAIPNARASIVDEAGHMVPVEQTDAVAQLIQSFLAGVERGS